MRTSNAQEFISPTELEFSFRSLSLKDIATLLMPFYLGLDFDTRRQRFGGAVSDEVIINHCARLDLDQAIVLGCASAKGLICAIELHPTSLRWQAVELVAASSTPNNRVMILGHLLQLAAFVVGRRGCGTIYATLEAHDRDLLELLRDMGPTEIKGDIVRIDLGEYARMHGLAGVS